MTRPQGGPSVLVIAAPRSGSSWFAESLGSSPDLVYRREPLTQAMLKRGADPFRHVEPAMLSPVQRDEIEAAFAPADGRRALVKEVTPLRVPALIEVAAPVVVELIRHPLAVATSQLMQGWRFGDQPPDRFAAADRDLVDQLRALWPDASDTVRTVAYTAATTVAVRRCEVEVAAVYEDFVAKPGRFADLAATLGVSPGPPPSADPGADDRSVYGTSRTPGYDPHRWRQIVDPADIAAAMAAWRSFGLADYPDASWDA